MDPWKIWMESGSWRRTLHAPRRMHHQRLLDYQTWQVSALWYALSICYDRSIALTVIWLYFAKLLSTFIMFNLKPNCLNNYWGHYWHTWIFMKALMSREGTITICYTSSRNACMRLVEIASHDIHQIMILPSRDIIPFMNIHICLYCPH